MRLRLRTDFSCNKHEALTFRDECRQKDVVDDEAELTYLKLKLRIIEIQTLPHVPKRDQDSLSAGIERWKLDWVNVNKRYRKRRWKRESIIYGDKQGRSAGVGICGADTL